MRTPARTTTAALATALILTGCNGNNDTTTETDIVTQTETATATADPQATQAQVTEQVIDYYNRVFDLRSDDVMLGESAREFATYRWIDQANAATARLLGGGRTLEYLEATVTDAQVLTFNDTGGGSDPWTITLNLCVDSRADYREEDGTIIDDPNEVYQSAVEVTARYDGLAKVWKLTEYDRGDTTACGYATQAAEDGAAATEAP